MKDKEISEEELFDELDTMYQRVADIEKEEAAEQTPPPQKVKPKQKRRRPYRTIIIMASVFLIVVASVLAVTIFDPTALLERLKTVVTRPSTVATSPPPKKRSTVAPSPAVPKPPVAATSQEPPKPSVAATSSAPPASSSAVPSPTVSPRLPPASPAVQTKQEAAKNIQGEPTKTKPPEIVKPNKPAPSGRYYAIQVGAFRDMENVRELVDAFKKEGLEAHWVTMKGLHRVLVGQFTDENEAAAFLKDKKIFNQYPGSFVKEISPSKINR